MNSQAALYFVSRPWVGRGGREAMGDCAAICPSERHAPPTGGPASQKKAASRTQWIPEAALLAAKGLYASSASIIEWAAFLPAPMARMTVAAPVTMSPPAQMRGSDVRPFSSASM